MSEAALAMAGKRLLTSNEIQDRYSDALLTYLAQPMEHSFLGALKLGELAMGKGLGVQEMAAIHHESLRTLLLRTLMGGTSARADSDSQARRAADLGDLMRTLAPDESTASVKAAADFFGLSIAPFEASRQEAQEAAAALHHQVRRFEDQARRIAHALYDETMQILATAHLVLHQIAGNLPPEDQAALSQVGDLLDQIEAQLAAFSQELRPVILDHLGLDAAINWLAGHFAKSAGLDIKVEASSAPPIPAALATVLFRSIHEALTNISKHARATLVSIKLEPAGESVTCSIRDNGIGFNRCGLLPARGERGLGLIGIRESLRALGGTLSVKSSMGHGCELTIRAPLNAGSPTHAYTPGGKTAL